MVPGAPGVWVAGLHVPEAVVEELRPGGEPVPIHPRLMVVLTVRVITQNRESVTLWHVLLMVPGAPGLNLHVPGAVVEEQRPSGDPVTVQPRHTVVETVRGMALNKHSVTLSSALYQVSSYPVAYYLTVFVSQWRSTYPPLANIVSYRTCRTAGGATQWRRGRSVGAGTVGGP